MTIFKIPPFIINLLSVYSANAINGVLGIIAVPLVVAALGNEGYGIYSIYIILASYVVLIDFGVTKHFVRLMSSTSDKDQQAEYLQTALGWYLVLSIILVCALPPLIYIVIEQLFPVPEHFKSSVTWIVILSVAEYVLAIPIMLTQAYTVANHEFKRYSNFLTICGVFKYGLMFLAAWLYKNPAMVVVFLVSRRVFELFFMHLFLLKPPKSAWKPRLNGSELKDVLVNSSVMSVAQFLQITIVSIGAVFVNRHFGVAVLGNYRAAFDLASKIWFFSNGLGLIVFPKFSQLLSIKKERESLYIKMNLWLEKSWTGYLLISILGIMCASWLLPQINLGNTQIVTFFKLLIFGLCLNAHTNVSYEYLLADSRYGKVALLSLSVLIILWLSYFSLVDIAGPYAIGWAWIASQTIYALAADTLVIFNGSTLWRQQIKPLSLKVLIFTIACVCLFSGLGACPVTMVFLAPMALIVGVFILLKDFKELKLFFR
jgi:O-antigen/teichoic acid export membrane protein